MNRKKRKRLMRQNAQHECANEKDYQSWWHTFTKPKNNKKVKRVQHDDDVLVPWEWELKIKDPDDGRKSISITGNKKPEETPKNELFTQGGELFMIYKGKIQKLTPMHLVKVIGGQNDTHWYRPSELVEHTIAAENKARG